MSFRGILRGAALGLACCGMVIPQVAVGGDTVVAKSAKAASKISDVALGQSGTLTGRVVDAQGKPVAGATVAVGFKGKSIATTTTAKNGAYRVNGLRGGLHQIVAGRSSNVVRLWSTGTAPKSAAKHALSVSGKVVRGQYGPQGGYVDQGYVDPGYAQGGYVDPGYGYGGQGYVDPGYVDPGYGVPGYPVAAASGFGMLDIVTLATVGTSTAALIYAIDNSDTLDDLEDRLASP